MAEKIYRLINKGKSTYNGIRAGEIAEVAEENKAYYLDFGFEVLGKTITDEAPAETGEEEITIDTYTAPQLKEILETKENQDKLAELGLAYTAKARKPALYEQYQAVTGAEAAEGEDTGEADYKTLLIEAGIAFEDADDLKILAEENGLV